LIESVRGPVWGEQGEVGARAAATVEDAGAGRARESLPDERLDEPPEAAEPEVTLFGARRRAQQIVHAALYLFCDN
jgi:hypothetical protein